MPPKDPPVECVGNVASVPAAGASRKRPKWLAPTIATTVAVLLLVVTFPCLHLDGHRVIRVTCRLVSDRTDEPIVGARVLTVTPGDLKLQWSGEKAWGKWQRCDAERESLVQAEEEVDAWMCATYLDSVGARSAMDGSVEFVVRLWRSADRTLLWTSEHAQEPEDEVAALWVAPEGREPVIVHLAEGNLRRHQDGEDHPIWGTYDLGIVVVPDAGEED